MGRRLFTCVSWAVLAAMAAGPALRADGAAQTLPFAQNWSNPGLITANDNWAGVPGILGYLGQDLTTVTGTDPQTILTPSTLGNDLDVIANQSNPNTLATGGVAEFDGITNPSVALNGSGTADAPHVVLHLDTRGYTSVNVSYNLRDLDGSVDNSIQAVALQYRVGSSGNFVNLPAGFVADATSGPSLANLVTPVSVTLPGAAADQSEVQVRIISTNAVGNDEWVGIDDIAVTGTPLGTPVTTMAPWSPCFQVSGACAPGSPDGQPATVFTFTADASAPAGLDHLEWDFDGNGTADQSTPIPGAPPTASGVTTTHVYGVVGSFRPQVRAVDTATAVGAWDAYDISGVPLDLDVVAPILEATLGAWSPCFTVAGNCAAGSPDGLATTPFVFTAGASAPAGIDHLDWDFDGDGLADATTPVPGAPTSVTGVTTSHTYGVAGSFSPSVRVVDVGSGVSPWDPFDIGGVPVTLETVVPVAVHDVQGNGSTSPLVGQAVATSGIVTGVKVNGVFIQAADAATDADPTTSEGVFVFTGGPAPAGAVAGNELLVSGTVAEFVPAADPSSPPFTEIANSPSVVVLSTGNALPSAVVLTAADTSPAGSVQQLERLEGMRVSVPSLTTIAPTMGGLVEATATATSNGVSYGVITGIARPFREPGVEVPDPLPPGSPCCVPRFDANPERLRVDADGQVGAATLDVGTGAVVTNLVGPLDYAFRTYTILPDPGSPPGVSGGPSPRAVSAPAAEEVTVGSFNLQRFFDTVNDPLITEPVLTPTAFTNRLAKASLGIRNFLRQPDILGVAEVENLAALQALRDRVNADAVAAGGPDPVYVAYLVEGNDPGGIDVGFLVKTGEVAPGVPRVTVNTVVQEGADATYVNPNTGLPETLFDRPPLWIDAVVQGPGGAFPITVVMNHLRSLNGIDDPTPSGSGTEGARVRAKRAAQAEYMASFVDDRQDLNPSENLVLAGDFNAFEFNDGYVDVMGGIAGQPAPADQVVRPISDVVDPNLVNLTAEVSAAERYSYVFDGSAQVLDHVLVNAALVAATSSRRLEHARLGADFPEISRNDPATAVRLSDHDALVTFLRPAAAGARFFTLAPCRVVDTRAADGPALAAGSTRTFTLAGRCGIPPSAQAIALNVAVTAPGATGHLRLYPAGTPVPTVSSINYAAGQTRTNNAIASLSAQGELSVFCSQGAGSVHLILDVSGYFE